MKTHGYQERLQQCSAMKVPGFKAGPIRVPKVGDWVLDYHGYAGSCSKPKLRKIKRVSKRERELRDMSEFLVGRIDKDRVQTYIPLGKHKYCSCCRGVGYMVYADSWDRDNGKTCSICKGWGVTTYYGKALTTVKRKR